MSRFGGVGGESKVYVNNMNTRYPAVDIPGRVSKIKHIKSMRPKNTDLGDDDHDLHEYGGAVTDTLQKELPTQQTILKSGDELHQNLEEVYARIMKRLQREVNYDEINRIPLATQFGMRNWEGNGPRRSSTSSGSEAEGGSSGRGSADKVTSNLNPISRLTKGEGEKPIITSFKVDRAKKEEVGEVEYSLAQQPCPETLRLVIYHVAQMLMQKLELAVRGSLKDALRYIFESKALLDRLLKEIPMYSTFQGNAETLTSTQKAAQAVQIHDMFQHFRKLPVVVPRGQYAREAISGAVVPVISTLPGSGGPSSASTTVRSQSGGEAAPSKESLPAVASNALPELVSSPETTRSIVGQYTEMARDILKGGETDINERDIPLPPGYAKSARLAQNAGSEELTPTAPPTTLKTFLPETKAVPVPPLFPGGIEAFESRPATGEEDGAQNPPQRLNASPSKTFFRSTNSRGSKKNEYPVGSREAYRVKMTDAATLTEENNTNIVKREDYENLHNYSQQLEVQVAEAKRGMMEALNKLVEEKDYGVVRTRVIKYIRETIFRECNVLRSQLQMAEQKEHALTQRLANAGTVYSTPARGSATNERTTSFSIAANRSQRIAAKNVPSTRGGGGHLEDSSASDLADNPKSRSSEVTRVQSLLDLALLAVESEAVLSREEWNSEVPRDVVELRHPKKEMDEVVSSFEQQQRILKERIIAIKVGHSHMIAAKDEEIARLRKLADFQYVRSTLIDAVQDLRQELRKTKNSVHDILNGFRIFMMGSLSTLANRAVLVDQQLQEFKAMKTSQTALMDLIRSASALFLPMLTDEYARGYHPWPAKIRNSIDPLSQVVQNHYGPKEVVRLREPLIYFSDMYIAIHKYVTSQLVVPDVTRPSTGRQLSQICGSMMLSPLATIDMVYNIRLRYDKELQLKKQIAAVNAQILWKAHLQRVKTERCISALLEGSMDPHTTTLPVSRTVNRLAERRGQLAKERSALQKERMDNAKELYRLWKDRQIDIFEGYAVPTTQNRVALLSSAQVSGIRNATGAAVRTQPGGSKLIPMMTMADGEKRSRVSQY